jgi:hypothetical protein
MDLEHFHESLLVEVVVEYGITHGACPQLRDYAFTRPNPTVDVFDPLSADRCHCVEREEPKDIGFLRGPNIRLQELVAYRSLG